MSENDEQVDKLQELTKRLASCNKNIKTIMEMMNMIDGKLDGALAKSNAPSKEEEKEKIDTFFQSKSIGRPQGSFSDKQKQYLKMLNDGKIKQPKQSTTKFYNRVKDGDKYRIMD